MRARLVAELYRLSDPRTVAFVVAMLLAALAAAGALLPTYAGGGLLAPVSGGSCNS